MKSRNNLDKTCASNSFQRGFETAFLYKLPSRRFMFELIKQMAREFYHTISVVLY